MPSRACIWTGRYPQNHRVTANGIALRKTEVTMAHAFQQAGYHTANIGKLHFLPHFGRDHTQNDVEYAGYGYETNLLSDEPGCYPDAYIRWVEEVAPEHLDAVRVPMPGSEERGHFHEWIFQAPEEYSHPAWIAHQAIEFLEETSDARPFFLSLGFCAPHPPLNPPQRYVDLYRTEDLPLPIQHPSEMEESPYRDLPPERWQRMKAFFYAMCSMVDHYVGRVLDTLKAMKLEENAIIVFMSDHGDALGDHGQVSKSAENYESIVRLPCLIRWPHGLPAGRRVKGLVETVDLFPTFCEFCDVPVPFGVKGQNFGKLLRGETEEGREDILIEIKDPKKDISLKTLRTEDYKYFRHHDGREVLYDLREDDEEVFDRAQDSAYQTILQELRQRLLDRLINAEDDLPPKTHLY